MVRTWCTRCCSQPWPLPFCYFSTFDIYHLPNFHNVNYHSPPQSSHVLQPREHTLQHVLGLSGSSITTLSNPLPTLTPWRNMFHAVEGRCAASADINPHYPGDDLHPSGRHKLVLINWPTTYDKIQTFYHKRCEIFEMPLPNQFWKTNRNSRTSFVFQSSISRREPLTLASSHHRVSQNHLHDFHTAAHFYSLHPQTTNNKSP